MNITPPSDLGDGTYGSRLTWMNEDGELVTMWVTWERQTCPHCGAAVADEHAVPVGLDYPNRTDSSAVSGAMHVSNVNGWHELEAAYTVVSFEAIAADTVADMVLKVT